MQFTERSGDDAADEALIAAVGRGGGRVVLATSEVNEFGETKLLGGERTLRQTGARGANGLLRPDPDGISRRVDHAIDGLETLAVATVESATGRQVPAGRIPRAGAWIDYRGPPGTIETVSFSDVLRGRVANDALADRIVVVGALAPQPAGRPSHLGQRGATDVGGGDPRQRGRHGSPGRSAVLGARAGWRWRSSCCSACSPRSRTPACA